MNHAQQLDKKIADKTARIAVFGLGYVGLPLALRFAEAGFQVTGFDIDADKVAALNRGESYMQSVSARRVAQSRERLRASADIKECAADDALIICVPTPLGNHREPDLRFITQTADAICPHLRAGQLVALESTTYPGTCEEELLPRIAARGLEVGRDGFLVYSPEREDPGNRQFNIQTTPKLCAGHTRECLQLGCKLYAAVVDEVVAVDNIKTAEMAKLLENIYRAVNIGLVNELKIVADKMQIDIHQVINAAATKPFGFTPFYPGPGLGGHCIPVDPFYLAWKAKAYGLKTEFIELAGEINSRAPFYVLEKIGAALNEQKKSINGARILILGIAYKKNVDDSRESPALLIINELLKQGAKVEYADPHIPKFPRTRKYQLNMQSVEVTPAKLKQCDLAVILTDHDAFDFDLIAKHARMLVDTRGRIDKHKHKHARGA